MNSGADTTRIGVTDGAVRLWFEDRGDLNGPAVLLVAGQGGDCLAAWDDEFIAPLLELGFRVVRFDNRDSGLSSDTDSDEYTVEDLADDALRVLEAVGVGSAHVIGHSMGGMVAQQLAIDHTSHVRSLTLISTSPDPAIAPPEPAYVAFFTAGVVGENSFEGFLEAAVQSARLQAGRRRAFDEVAFRARA